MISMDGGGGFSAKQSRAERRGVPSSPVKAARSESNTPSFLLLPSHVTNELNLVTEAQVNKLWHKFIVMSCKYVENLG